MPRQSVASITTPFRADNGTTTRIEPPKNLNATEAELFRSIVRSLEPRHFAQADAPLLARYCENLCLARIAAEHLRKDGAVDANGKLSAWLRVQEKLDRAIVALASRLRLCPQSRIGPKDAYRRAANARDMSFYDVMRQERDQEQEADAG